MATTVDKQNPIPRYLQVRQILEESIRSGRYRRGERLPGERDLALGYRVSQMTVNKAIMSLVQEGWLRREVGNGTFVHEDLRLPVPQSITVGFAMTLSLEFAEGDFYLSSLLRGIQRAIANEPVSLKVIEAPVGRLYETIMEAGVDGHILIDVLQHGQADVERMVQEGQKFVLLGADQETLGATYVDGDNASGTRNALEHLIGLGHRRIAGAFAYLEMCNSRQRLKSFRGTLEGFSLDLPDRFIIDLGNGALPCEQFTPPIIELLTGPDRPTAVLCGGFFVALEIMRIAREAGLRIPEDLSVVGFDDPLAARYLTPPLTTVRQPLEEMGQRAMNYLCNWLLKNERPPLRTVLPETLIVRDSTDQAL